MDTFHATSCSFHILRLTIQIICIFCNDDDDAASTYCLLCLPECLLWQGGMQEAASNKTNKEMLLMIVMTMIMIMMIMVKMIIIMLIMMTMIIDHAEDEYGNRGKEIPPAPKAGF